jgi:hypothetical protein
MILAPEWAGFIAEGDGTVLGTELYIQHHRYLWLAWKF